jgi:branched-chain amino acid transport system substrate-binding protein
LNPICAILVFATLICINLPLSGGICIQGNLTIGALLPLSGDYAGTGLSAQIALEQAASDINQMFSDTGRSTRINIVIKDTKTDPEITFQALKALQAQGLRIIIGPEDSASLLRVRDYANASGIILISGSSTAPSLAIAHDTTFRMASDDTYLGGAIVALMKKDGIKAVLPLARDDLWGNDLINTTTKSLNSEGDVMLYPIKYSPNTGNFTPALADLRSSLGDAMKQYGNASIAVYLIAFGEAKNILSQASGDPILSSVRWYGSDPSEVLIQKDEPAAQFASKVRFIYPTFGQENSTVYRKISEEVRKRYGIDAVSYAINDYDAAWLVAYTYLLTGSDDPETFRKMLPIYAKTYRGYSGDGVLNDAGDRAFAIYTFWSMKASNGTLQYRPMSKYVFNPYEGAYWS